ncbi:immunoglobulin mu Fc receptor [Cynocephalus volans]|uniref:immunoglobulin mu Fc receptor n=1 Tax=Cynocephalus volans TaxID=110931 RepID=UPI002FC65100
MDLLLWSLYFLPVSGVLKSLPEVKLEGELGGSVLIECPLPVMNVRIYLCREMAKSGVCATVVSNTNFVKEEYRSRVTLELCQDKNLFLVEVTKLTKSDSGVYACGVGVNTDWAKTLQVTLSVHNEYEPFWEEEPTPEPPKLFQKFLRLQMSFWQMSAHASSEFISKVTTPAQRTEAPPANHTSPTTLIRHYPRVSRASSVPAANPSTLLPSTTASKTPTWEGLLRPQTASYNHHIRLHRQRAFDYGSQSGREGPGFHILIATFLGLILIALLGLVMKRAIQRRKALSRRVRRLAVRIRAPEASRRPGSLRPLASQRPHSQNNVYSACPRRARGPDAAGESEAPLPGPGSSAPAPPQVSEGPWLPAPSLKTSYEYVGFYHQPAATMEDNDSDDYINIPSLTHPPSCPLGPDLGANESCLSVDF